MIRHLVVVVLATTWMASPVSAVEVRMGVKPGLKFDVAGFHAKPSENVKLVFANNDEMMHNIVFCRPGTRLETVEAAIALGADGLEKQFVPDIPAVLASTPIIMPGQTFTLSFKAPAQEGKYPYVCTFPGHGFVMHGVLFVAGTRPVELDVLLKKAAAEPVVVQASALSLTKAKLERTFMPDCSPAAIAVALPGGQAYCWDAGNSRLRYVWRDGFIQKNGSYGRWRTLPTILGPIYYREPELPFRFANREDEVPETRFLGYRLVDGIPEFRYRLGDCEVREFLAKLPGKSGLLRRFRISGLKGGLLFKKDPLAGADINASAGTWKGDVLHLSEKEAVRFTLRMVEVPNKGPIEYWSMNDLSRSYPRKGSLVEGHRGRAWQFRSSTIISTEHKFVDFRTGGTVSFWIRAQDPDGNIPAICGWGNVGQGPSVSYEGSGRGLLLGLPGDAPVPAGNHLEAENAKVQGASIQRKVKGHTGSGYVDFVAQSGESIEWKVPVHQAGRHLLRFRYALHQRGGSRPLRVELDGKVLAERGDFRGTGDWERWGNLDFHVELSAGQHVVRLSSIGSSGPNIDSLQLVHMDKEGKGGKPAPVAPEPKPGREPALDKEWHHVCVSYGISEASFYLDGKLIRKEPFETRDFPDDAKFYIGQKVKGGAFLMDEFYLYARSLSESEIRELSKR